MPLNMNTIGTGTGIGGGSGSGAGVAYNEYVKPLHHTVLSSYNFSSIKSYNKIGELTFAKNTDDMLSMPPMIFKGEMYSVHYKSPSTHVCKSRINISSNNTVSVTRTEITNSTLPRSVLDDKECVNWNDRYFLYVASYDPTGYDQGYWLFRSDEKSSTAMIKLGGRYDYPMQLLPYGEDASILLYVYTNDYSNWHMTTIQLDSNCTPTIPDTGSLYLDSSFGQMFGYGTLSRGLMVSKDRIWFINSESNGGITEYKFTFRGGDITAGIQSITRVKTVLSYSFTSRAASILQNLSYPLYNKYLLWHTYDESSVSGYGYIKQAFQISIDWKNNTCTIKNILPSQLRFVDYGYETNNIGFLNVDGHDVIINTSYYNSGSYSSSGYNKTLIADLNGTWTSEGKYDLIELSCKSGDTIYAQNEFISVSINGSDFTSISGTKYKCTIDATYKFMMKLPDTSITPAVIIQDKEGNIFNTGFSHVQNGEAIGAYLLKDMKLNGKKINMSGYIDLREIYKTDKRISITF